MKDKAAGEIRWISYPKSRRPPALAGRVIEAFQAVASEIGSWIQDDLGSNAVLARVAPGLASAGFQVETSKLKADKIAVPVLLGEQGIPEKSFHADAFHPGATPGEGFVVEVEAGRGVVNNQFLKDLFQACMMQDVAYLAIAVRQRYAKGGRVSNDFAEVCKFFNALYASDRLALPLRAIVVIGY